MNGVGVHPLGLLRFGQPHPEVRWRPPGRQGGSRQLFVGGVAGRVGDREMTVGELIDKLGDYDDDANVDIQIPGDTIWFGLKEVLQFEPHDPAHVLIQTTEFPTMA